MQRKVASANANKNDDDGEEEDDEDDDGDEEDGDNRVDCMTVINKDGKGETPEQVSPRVLPFP